MQRPDSVEKVGKIEKIMAVVHFFSLVFYSKTQKAFDDQKNCKTKKTQRTEPIVIISIFRQVSKTVFREFFLMAFAIRKIAASARKVSMQYV